MGRSAFILSGKGIEPKQLIMMTLIPTKNAFVELCFKIHYPLFPTPKSTTPNISATYKRKKEEKKKRKGF